MKVVSLLPITAGETLKTNSDLESRTRPPRINACSADAFIRGDWIVRWTDMVRKVDIGLGSANSTVSHQLDYTKVCASWILRYLTDEHHARCAGLPHAFDTSSPWKGSLCAANFTGDGTWVNQRELEEGKHSLRGSAHHFPSKEIERNAVSEKDQGNCVLVQQIRATFGFPWTWWRCHSW